MIGSYSVEWYIVRDTLVRHSTLRSEFEFSLVGCHLSAHYQHTAWPSLARRYLFVQNRGLKLTISFSLVHTGVRYVETSLYIFVLHYTF